MMLPAYDMQCRRIIHFVLREVTILDFNLKAEEDQQELKVR